MSVIIGLDISLTSPGWCRIDTENGARTFDTLHYEGDLGDMGRINRTSRDLVDLCRSSDLVVMEGLSMNLPRGPGGPFMPKGRYDTVGLTYIVRLCLYNSHHETLLVPPTVLKKWASGKGNSPKNIMLRAVSQRWGVEPADDNQADAIALAEFGRAHLDRSISLPDFQKECLPRAERLFTAA